MKGDLEALRAAEREVAELESARVGLRRLGRSTLRLGVPAPRRHPLAVISSAGSTAARLGVVAGLSAAPGYLVVFHGDQIRETLAVGPGARSVLLLTAPLVTALAAFAAAARLDGVRSRASAAGAGIVALGFFIAAFATSIKVLLLALSVCGLGAAVAPGLHVAEVADDRPPTDRLAGFTVYRALEAAGPAGVMLLVVALTSVQDLTWRATALVAALLAGASGLASLRGRAATPGRWDTDEVVAAIVEDTGAPVAAADEPALGAFEQARRVTGVRSARTVLTLTAMLGLLTLPLTVFVLFLLAERFGFTRGERGVVYVGCWLTAATVAAVVLPRLESAWQASPSQALRRTSAVLLVGLVGLLVAGIGQQSAVSVLGLAVATSALLLVRPVLDVVLVTVVPPEARAMAGALAGSAFWAAAALGGIFVLNGMDSSFGPGGALIAGAIIGAQAVPLLRLAAREVDSDLDRMVDQVVESTELRQAVARGAHLPMLACRGIDFSYGQLQVLFGVDFTVDDGEMVALLGTNGAGKSTLLRVISGLGLPSTGSVRLRGKDITYVDTERRMRLGISQVPGGRGVYPPMTVLENLRVIGFSAGRDRAAVERGIEETFATFPRLDERKRQLAATLSGGEQQMLSLARAIVVKPQLLLIDELSLGLAPKIVGELLESVRRINAGGTAVVLVEQSVNVALSLVDHAYFMEKGEVRFDGPAKQLLERPDLLRSVFLEGASGQERAS